MDRDLRSVYRVQFYTLAHIKSISIIEEAFMAAPGPRSLPLALLLSAHLEIL